MNIPQLSVPLPPEMWQPLGAVLAAGIGGGVTLLGRWWFGRGSVEQDERYLSTELRKARQDAEYWYSYSQQMQRLNDALAHHQRNTEREADAAVE